MANKTQYERIWKKIVLDAQHSDVEIEEINEESKTIVFTSKLFGKVRYGLFKFYNTDKGYSLHRKFLDIDEKYEDIKKFFNVNKINGKCNAHLVSNETLVSAIDLEFKMFDSKFAERFKK